MENFPLASILQYSIIQYKVGNNHIPLNTQQVVTRHPRHAKIWEKIYYTPAWTSQNIWKNMERNKDTKKQIRRKGADLTSEKEKDLKP